MVFDVMGSSRAVLPVQGLATLTMNVLLRPSRRGGIYNAPHLRIVHLIRASIPLRVGGKP